MITYLLIGSMVGMAHSIQFEKTKSKYGFKDFVFTVITWPALLTAYIFGITELLEKISKKK